MRNLTAVGSAPNCSIRDLRAYYSFLDNTSQRMKDSKFNYLSYDVLFTSIAYDLIELEVIHNPSIKPAATVRYSPVIFLSLSTYVASQSRGLESAGGHSGATAFDDMVLQYPDVIQL